MRHLRVFETESAFQSEQKKLSSPWVTLTNDDSVAHYEVSTPRPQQNNEIWYTSSDGNVVTPNKTTAFGGATILSNEYSDGQGVITFDRDLTEIGTIAFRNCISLTSVNIPNSVTTIGQSVFYGCSNLASVNIPDSVTTIRHQAFMNCSKIQNIYITDLAAWCKISGLGELMVHGLGNKHLFLNGEEVFDLVIPDSITTIGGYAFAYCKSLTSVVIPDSVTSIGTWTFYACVELTSVEIGNSVTSIGNDAFFRCPMTSVNIPDSVTSIGNGAFSWNTNLTSVNIPDSVTTIGTDAFKNVPHIEYHGTATGSPWGALSMN